MRERILVAPSEHLVSVKREWHTRKPGCYMVVDRHGKYLLLSQRLQLIVALRRAWQQWVAHGGI